MALSDWLPWRTSARAQGAPEMPTLPGGAPIGPVYGEGRRIQRSDPLEVEGAASQTLVSALRSADTGRMATLSAIIDGTLVRDGRLAGVARTRILAITSRRWAVRPPAGYEQDRQALEVAQAITTVLYETPAFSRRRAELAQGILRPVAVLEHDWQIDRRGWRVSRPRYIEPDRVDCDTTTGAWVIADEGPHKGRRLADFPAKFVIHSPTNGLALPPWRRGSLRPLLGLALAKRYGLRWWIEMLERYGQPQVYGRAPADASKELLDSITDGIRSLSSQWAAAFKGDVALEALPVSVNDRVHREFADWINTEYSVNLLGGNLVTEVKDGQTFGSQAQDRVRGDILSADLTELDETIVDQWIAPTVRFNAPGAPVPVLETVVTASRPWSLAEYQAGLCTLDEYRVSNGADPLGDERGASFASPQLPTFAQGQQILSVPALPPGGAGADDPFRSTSDRTSGPTSPTHRSGLARLLSE